ncbi:hypothetical protein [Mycolicibacterium mageritense]|uniref:hypothetical protein n=1 Tax=Mycolicibacterium mageritense TaxID=53462 RepID=UPI001E29A149|nr:hypothetical protein [Mycolicibacterium mageritense]MCC9182569.1 hypothetical protein [Mycolicibacterium mageritense]
MRIQVNHAGFRELLTGAAAQSLLDEQAERVASEANSVPSTTNPPHDEPYYRIEDGSDADRARRRIIADGARAMAHEAKTQALLRAAT